MIITSNEYWEEIKSIAANLIEENQEEADERGDCVLEFINDNSLDHEVIDGHQWIIYYSYNLAIIEHSDNEDYMLDCFGSEYLGCVMERDGLKGLHQAIAFHAMLADVQEELNSLELEEGAETC